MREEHIHTKERVMNKDQIAGAAKDAAGKVERKTGKVVGSDKMQVKGAFRQAEGKTQKAVGNAEERVKDANKR
jgi:uncharacterized protein YjbJ (UPF0337 family)